MGGTLNPGADAAGASWVDADDFGNLPVTEGLTETLTSWAFPAKDMTDRPIFSVAAI
jgi:hypothetical protein